MLFSMKKIFSFIVGSAAIAAITVTLLLALKIFGDTKFAIQILGDLSWVPNSFISSAMLGLFAFVMTLWMIACIAFFGMIGFSLLKGMYSMAVEFGEFISSSVLRKKA